jgi:signal transduction histidine kinase/ligand-binding sensor domain-containing protein
MAHAAAVAPSRDRALFELHHTSWTVKDGAPGDVQALAQTTDGYLWLGTSAGLYRFDGVRFERYEPLDRVFPAAYVFSLYATPDNGLLVGLYYHGVCLIRNGEVITYPVADGKKMENVHSLAITRDGVTWAATAEGFFRLVNGGWKQVGAESGYPWPYASSLLVDRTGTLWVGNYDIVVYLPQGEEKFRRTAEVGAFHIYQILQGPDGAIWVVDEDSSIHPITTDTRSVYRHRPEIRVGGYSAIFDDAGCLWFSTTGHGVGRLRFPEELKDSKALENGAEVFSDKNGLTTNEVEAVLEDREGNIWVGTDAGLDRFRSANMVPSAFPLAANDMVLIAGDHGDIWAGGLNWPFSHLEGTHITDLSPLHHLHMTSGVRDADGIFWLGNTPGLVRGTLGQLHNFPVPKEVSDWRAVALAKDKSGTLWASIGQSGVFRLVKGTWSKLGREQGLPEISPDTLYADAEGRVWMGYVGEGLAVFDNGKVRVFNTTDEVAVGDVPIVYEHGSNIWIGGETGLALYREGKFRAIHAANSVAFQRISGIVETADGDLWLNAANGIVKIARSEIERSLRDSSYRVASRQFDYLDGLPGSNPRVPVQTAVQGSDGRLWFSLSKGIAWIDPTHILKNSIPPPVYISSVTVGGKEYRTSDGVEFPPRPGSIRIAYTALSYTIPERVRFRYKLEGFETDWQDSGTRREAFYTNLAPGKYRFRVIASNNDDVWNEAGTSLAFSVRPAFYQTRWFGVACGFAFLAFLWGIYQLRVQQLQRQFNVTLDVRVKERTRIARELHDTLLQNFQACLVTMQAARNLFSKEPDKAVRTLDDAIDTVAGAIDESRDAIQGLRSLPMASGNLGGLLTTTSQDLAKSVNTPPVFELIEEGEQRSLSPAIKEDICRIALEILRNAYRHANARTIEAEIRYGEDVLRLRIRDDGRGMNPRVLEEGGVAGHYGLRGMRERAQRIGATLDFWTEVGAGTEIQLTVPASVAYENSGDPIKSRTA